MSEIFKQLCQINAEITAIGKEKKNQQQGFSYRGIDDVMNELHSLFAKHKVIIIPECLERTETERQSKSGSALFYIKERIKYTFYAEDGSSVFAIIDGEGMDSGDKGTNKAMSIALKYCLTQMFLIPTEETKDPDSETHEVKPNSDDKKKKAFELNAELDNFIREIDTVSNRDELTKVYNKYKHLKGNASFDNKLKAIGELYPKTT